MKLRDKGKYSVEISDKIIAKADTAEDKNTFIEKDNALTQMQFALHQLSTDQYQCIILFYFEKKSYLEIADKTGFSMMQVKSNIQNGKRNLKLLMEKKQNNGR